LTHLLFWPAQFGRKLVSGMRRNPVHRWWFSYANLTEAIAPLNHNKLNLCVCIS